MTETTVLPATPAAPGPGGRKIDLFVANTQNRLLSEARGQAQKDFLLAQEQDRLRLQESGRLGRMVRSGVRSMGRELYMAKRTKTHMQHLQEQGKTIGNEAAAETLLSAVHEGVRLEGALKDELVQMAQSLRDRGADPQEAQARMAQFLQEHTNDTALCEAFGVKKLNKRIISYASVDMVRFLRSVDANADGIDAIRLHVANMKADKSRAYGGKHSNKLNAIVSTSLAVAAIKTAGIRIPASVIRHVPGVGSALAGAGLGATRAYTREGMNQIHRSGNVVSGAERTDEVIHALEDSLHSGSDAASMRDVVLQLLPQLELQKEYGVSFFETPVDSLPIQDSDAAGNPIMYTPEQYMTHLFARVVHNADIASLSDAEKQQFREELAKRQERLMPAVESKLKEMKLARRKKALAGAVAGAAAGATFGVGGKWVAGRVEGAYRTISGLRGAKAEEAVSFKESTQTLTSSEPANTSITGVPPTRESTTIPPTSAHSPTTNQSVPTSQEQEVGPTVNPPPSTEPEHPGAPNPVGESETPPPSEAPATTEQPLAPPSPEAHTPARSAVVESLGSYAVQQGDTVTWIIKDHLLKSHPELTYDELDQPPYDRLIQESIRQLAEQKGVSLESLSHIQAGDRPFEGLDTHRVFDPLFVQFDQDHPTLTASEAVVAIVESKPEHIVVDLPVGGVDQAQVPAVARQEFEARLQHAFGVPSEQAHVIAQDLITARSDGYIAQGSLLDFVNRGAIDGHLIAHFDPKDIVGIENWRTRAIEIPPTVSLRPTEPNPEAREWLKETLQNYMSLRGRAKDRYTNEELMSLYVYIRGKKQDSVTVADLDAWFLNGRGSHQTLMDVGAQAQPVAPEAADQALPAEPVQAPAEAVELPPPIDQVHESQGERRLEQVGNWFEEHAAEAMGLGGGGVSVVATGLAIRHARNRRFGADSQVRETQASDANEAVEDVAPRPQSTPMVVIAHLPTVSGDREPIFPSVPDSRIGLPGRVSPGVEAGFATDKLNTNEHGDLDAGTRVFREVTHMAPDLSHLASEQERYAAYEEWLDTIGGYTGMRWQKQDGGEMVAVKGEGNQVLMYEGDSAGPIVAVFPRSSFQDFMVANLVDGTATGLQVQSQSKE